LYNALKIYRYFTTFKCALFCVIGSYKEARRKLEVEDVLLTFTSHKMLKVSILEGENATTRPRDTYSPGNSVADEEKTNLSRAPPIPEFFL
jgi:hypothetical protein